ncbi:ArsR/SmtB family transcription factor [Tundrisphaera sp. TA3]|uniref:ArsR/SmtB family transcription factor n=1 Tax=Tundrisphaera sp. TA3 TaxID=3435775 RepID=UPI003EC06042
MPTTKITPGKQAIASPAKPRTTKAAGQRSAKTKRASIRLKHISDPTRLHVVLLLAEGEQHVGALCERLGQSQPAVSHHLALLRHGGIISPRRQGKNNFYSLTDIGVLLSGVARKLVANA